MQDSRARALALLGEVRDLRQGVAAEGRAQYRRWRKNIIRRAFVPSALNFAHYLALAATISVVCNAG